MILLLLLSLPITSIQADIVELNHYGDCTGRELCEQIIWWRMHGPDYRVIAWRMRATAGDPVRVGDCWENRWTETKRRYVATARTRRETWTLYDPEVADRMWMNETARTEWRINLGRP
jgi:hypothetical protein